VRLGKNPSFFPATKLVLNGTVGSFLSTPSNAAVNAALSAPAAWEGRALVSATWTSAITEGVFNIMDVGSANCSLRLYRAAARAVFGQIVKPGGTFGGQNGQHPVFVNGSEHWLRMTWDPSTSTLNIYYSDDGVAWNLIVGGAVAGFTAVNVSTQPLRVGGEGTGAMVALIGYVKRFEFRSPIGGAILAGFDASQAKIGDTTCAGLNGETWTINGGASFQ